MTDGPITLSGARVEVESTYAEINDGRDESEMKDGGQRMENGKWRMVDGGQRMGDKE